MSLIFMLCVGNLLINTKYVLIYDQEFLKYKFGYEIEIAWKLS